ncbi:MAG: M14 family metallopeptidase [Vicinamibacterales bacterium]
MRRLALVVLLLAAPAHAEQVPSPEAFFGFRMGTDTALASWPAIREYFELVARASDRVELVDVGPTTDGHRLLGAIVSMPENVARLDAIKAANRRLADPRTLEPAEARALSASHTAVLVIGASIHATEIGATQAANELLHTLATTEDPTLLRSLRDLVVILIPSLNPDGHVLVTDWYRTHKGTPFEGSAMPWLYHKYVGHDLNRDAFMLNMSENRSLARFFYTEWHPQVFLTMHQMGMRGPRFFVPPNYDPIDANYDPLIWRTAGLLGHAMALRMEEDGRSGVVQSAMYDYYWPGYEDSAPLGHNTVCLLTEVASIRVASPVHVSPAELQGTPRGLPEYRPQVNFPNPWPGGLWTLRDIVEYNLSAAYGLINGVARYRQEIVQNFYTMGRRAVDRGRAGGPAAFVIPPAQHDPHAAAKLKNLLIEGAVEVHRATSAFSAGGQTWPAGSDLVLMAQPFRAYAKTLLERQQYPVRRLAPGAAAERPYDVAGWTLPYQMGVDVTAIDAPFDLPPLAPLAHAAIEPARIDGDSRPGHFVIDARGNGGSIAINRLLAAARRPSWRPDGAVIVTHSRRAAEVTTRIAKELGLPITARRGRPPAGLEPIARARVALYKPWVDNIDEGWTRWLLEQYEFPYTNIADADVRRGNLRAHYDVIILPDASAERLLSGHPAGVLPEPYTGGLGTEGAAALRAFVESGGTLVALDSAGSLAIHALNLPVRDVSKAADASELFCPGSILGLELEPAHPLAFGMRPRTSAFFAYGSAFDVTTPLTTEGHAGAPPHPPVEIVGRYPRRDVLMSGWLEGERIIAGRAAVVIARVGLGRAVLIGFRAQHRGQTHATFRLLFNAIHTSSR